MAAVQATLRCADNARMSVSSFAMTRYSASQINVDGRCFDRACLEAAGWSFPLAILCTNAFDCASPKKLD